MCTRQPKRFKRPVVRGAPPLVHLVSFSAFSVIGQYFHNLNFVFKVVLDLHQVNPGFLTLGELLVVLRNVKECEEIE